MIYTDLKLEQHAEDRTVIDGISAWVKENNTSIKTLANFYNKFSPCDTQDFEQQAIISAYEAWHIAVSKGEPEKFRGIFHRHYTSQCYMMTDQGIHSAQDVAPVLDWMPSYLATGLETDSTDSAGDYSSFVPVSVDQRTPETLLEEKEAGSGEVFEAVAALALEAMRPKEREVWEALLSGKRERLLAKEMGISRQRVEKLRDEGLKRIKKSSAHLFKDFLPQP